MDLRTSTKNGQERLKRYTFNSTLKTGLLHLKKYYKLFLNSCKSILAFINEYSGSKCAAFRKVGVVFLKFLSHPFWEGDH